MSRVVLGFDPVALSRNQLKYQLPNLYEKLLPKELLDFKIQETLATCDACAMAPHTYKANLKCCTFEPFLPNYLVGASLMSEQTSPTAKTAMLAKISERSGALPIGMTARISYQVSFNQSEKSDFGQREDWLCPYFNKEHNNCGVWKHRGSVCSTFFCKSDFGKAGIGFWAELNTYLNFVEMALLSEVLVHMDFSPRLLNECLSYLNRNQGTSEQMQPSIPRDEARRLWNGYFDDQVGFYKSCYEMVQSFDNKRLAEIMGQQSAGIEKKLFASMLQLGKL